MNLKKLLNKFRNKFGSKDVEDLLQKIQQDKQRLLNDNDILLEQITVVKDKQQKLVNTLNELNQPSISVDTEGYIVDNVVTDILFRLREMKIREINEVVKEMVDKEKKIYANELMKNKLIELRSKNKLTDEDITGFLELEKDVNELQKSLILLNTQIRKFEKELSSIDEQIEKKDKDVRGVIENLFSNLTDYNTLLEKTYARVKENDNEIESITKELIKINESQNIKTEDLTSKLREQQEQFERIRNELIKQQNEEKERIRNEPTRSSEDLQKLRLRLKQLEDEKVLRDFKVSELESQLIILKQGSGDDITLSNEEALMQLLLGNFDCSNEVDAKNYSKYCANFYKKIKDLLISNQIKFEEIPQLDLPNDVRESLFEKLKTVESNLFDISAYLDVVQTVDMNVTFNSDLTVNFEITKKSKGMKSIRDEDVVKINYLYNSIFNSDKSFQKLLLDQSKTQRKDYAFTIKTKFIDIIENKLKKVKLAKKAIYIEIIKSNPEKQRELKQNFLTKFADAMEKINEKFKSNFPILSSTDDVGNNKKISNPKQGLRDIIDIITFTKRAQDKSIFLTNYEKDSSMMGKFFQMKPVGSKFVYFRPELHNLATYLLYLEQQNFGNNEKQEQLKFFVNDFILPNGQKHRNVNFWSLIFIFDINSIYVNNNFPSNIRYINDTPYSLLLPIYFYYLMCLSSSSDSIIPLDDSNLQNDETLFYIFYNFLDVILNPKYSSLLNVIEKIKINNFNTDKEFIDVQFSNFLNYNGEKLSLENPLLPINSLNIQTAAIEKYLIANPPKPKPVIDYSTIETTTFKSPSLKSKEERDKEKNDKKKTKEEDLRKQQASNARPNFLAAIKALRTDNDNDNETNDTITTNARPVNPLAAAIANAAQARQRRNDNTNDTTTNARPVNPLAAAIANAAQARQRRNDNTNDTTTNARPVNAMFAEINTRRIEFGHRKKNTRIVFVAKNNFDDFLKNYKKLHSNRDNSYILHKYLKAIHFARS